VIQCLLDSGEVVGAGNAASTLGVDFNMNVLSNKRGGKQGKEQERTHGA